MTKSGCASGNTDGSNNLKDDSYDAFADYLTEVVKHFRDSWGITFRTLEPLNEPNASWWTGERQPGGLPLRRQQPADDHQGGGRAARGEGIERHDRSPRPTRTASTTALQHHARIRHRVARGHDADERP
jgi:hypothetical protein